MDLGSVLLGEVQMRQDVGFAVVDEGCELRPFLPQLVRHVTQRLAGLRAIRLDEQQIANKHAASIANVGVRYVLGRPAVAGVIVGARLGVAQHLTDNARVFGVQLDADDLSMIEAVIAMTSPIIRYQLAACNPLGCADNRHFAQSCRWGYRLI